MMKKYFALTIFSAALIVACTKNNKEDLTNNDGNNGGDTVTDTVYYASDIKPMMVTYCLGVDGQGCHVSVSTTGANGNFENYAGLKAKVNNGSIKRRVFDSPDMPPNYSTGPTAMTAADLAKFKAWVNQGALDN